jgi:hypothetical protein
MGGRTGARAVFAALSGIARADGQMVIDPGVRVYRGVLGFA